MSLLNPKYRLRFSVVLAFGVAAFLIMAGGAIPGAIVHADTLGPNLEVVSITGDLFSGTGPCLGGTSTVDTSATNPGISFTGIPTPCAGFSSTQSATISLAALNGYEIEDISASATCGVTGGDTLTLTFSSLVLTCPTETTVGTTSTLPTLDVTFAPTTSLDEIITLSNTFTPGGSSSLSAFSFNVSLVATPEPNTLTLMLIGLGLAFLMRKRIALRLLPRT